MTITSSVKTYRVKNWSNYNQLLQDRWNINLWFCPEVVNKWYKEGDTRTHYTNQTILICLTIRALFNLSLRATQGLMSSLIRRLNLPITCPHYTRLCRRASGLDKIKIPRKRSSQAFYICVDSTGLKVYGPGEWQAHMHRASQRRTWRKVHIAIDPITQQITSALLTPSSTGDGKVVPKLLNPLKDPLKKFYADGAYDSRKVYKYLYDRGIMPVIPVDINARQTYIKELRPRLGKKRLIDPHPELYWRNQAIAHRDHFIDPVEGVKDWKKSSGYHLRSLVETTMMRLKRTFTDKLRSRTLANQKTEIYVKCLILNKFIELGLPYTVPIKYPTIKA
ncbi:MAG: IS5 family transposase [Candidatus Paracaedibacteraceae bacterium]|nr:IS5 family transposase [Candidatus Paracaedibacteraceae bacterium]